MNTVLRHVVSLAAIAVGLFSGNAMGETVTVNDVLNVKFSELDLELTEGINDEGFTYWLGAASITSNAGSSLSYRVRYDNIDLFGYGIPSSTYAGNFYLPLSQPSSGKLLEDEVLFLTLHSMHIPVIPDVHLEPEDIFNFKFDVNESYAEGDVVVNVNLNRSWINFGDSDIYFSDIPQDGQVLKPPEGFDTLQAIHVEYAVTYYNVPSIPEPETYAMLLAGLGIVGAVARRHRLTRH
jgi:hypothetical protein